jgi:uncharacterized protein (DUF1015 family)
MATLHPFRALRPRPSDAPRVAAVPYDVVNTEEARELAADNPLSFLRVSRPELELPTDTDPYSDVVYRRAAQNFDRLKESTLVLEDEPAVYCYRLRMGNHEQIGTGACYSIDEYDRDVIKKHERTRRDKEDDRTRHMLELGAQTGPVFLTYQASANIDSVVTRVTSADPLFDFEAADAVRHTLWRMEGGDRDALVAAFRRIPALYIADGHHRAASAVRVRDHIRSGGRKGTPLGDDADHTTFLAVAFPHDQMQVLPYNRIVKDLAGLSSDAFLAEVNRRFAVKAGGPASPARKGEIAMYLAGRWYTLTGRRTSDLGPQASDREPRSSAASHDAVAALDVSVLQDRLLAPVLGIVDVRTDKRIDFVGGIRGTAALETLVDRGKAAVAFSMYPVSVTDLMAVSDMGAIMPPKSTWFEPKLRDGLLVHII